MFQILNLVPCVSCWLDMSHLGIPQKKKGMSHLVHYKPLSHNLINKFIFNVLCVGLGFKLAFAPIFFFFLGFFFLFFFIYFYLFLLSFFLAQI